MNNNDIEVNGFQIISAGDESAGINSSSYELKGYFHFFDSEELESFKKQLSELIYNYNNNTTNIEVIAN